MARDAAGRPRVETSMKIDDFLNRMFRVGTLEATLPGGRILHLGDGGGPHIALTVTDRVTLARIMAQPYMGAAEAYMDGRLTIQRGTLRELFELASRNLSPRPSGKKPGPLRRWWARNQIEYNSRQASRRNVAHHYDLSVDLYRNFLDDDLQYSCAYFENLNVTLDEAQAAKKRHILAKLDLRPGQRVLDIGCGWGGTALSIVGLTGAAVDGITLSSEQLETARSRAEAAGVADRAKFSLTDYRDVAGPYDRIVSIGMFEHVGRPHYDEFFQKIADLLTDDGVALIHSIGTFDGPSATNPFTTKYIFPGAYVPALSEVLPSVERAGLRIDDIEILRLHYAHTLRRWLERFEANRDKIRALYDERFCRMWECYLAGAEMGFRFGGHMNFQLQVTKRNDVLPITRDYMADAERVLAEELKRAA